MSKKLNLTILINLLENLDSLPLKNEIFPLIEQGAKLKKEQRIKLYLNWIENHKSDIKNLSFKINNILELLIGLTHLYRSSK